ncbi:MAG: type I-U CRISPR-associated helicase/endonuclease Cas3 [Deltaproteobacteria bacterium]|nr:type I-U CRISPR-associated helicase/endonuclease Cas3 [Deltaproteobacteria bacterium]
MAMMMPSFREYFTAAWGKAPFPWQERLVEEVLRDGWESLVLELPTGSGKTSALDVALYCLACAPERMPRRTVLVVDRRIVVDQAATHASDLLLRMTQASDGPVAAVAAALRATYTDEPGPPFRVAVMRGGMPRDNDWARWPHQPVVASSTVDQVGSRLLFRGYGLSRMSAPIHAGLIGNDTLVLLDEVHLARPFAMTLRAIEKSYRSGVDATHALPRRYAVVPMSATPPGQEPSARRFGLSDADREHHVLKCRLDARKPAVLAQVKVAGDDENKKLDALAGRAVEEARKLHATGLQVIGIIVNRVEAARLAYLKLVEEGVDALLLTGRMRSLERDVIVATRLLPLTSGERDRAHDKPFVVVATQCIEAGADLDLDGIVTECASLDALRQRFGRVDRRGSFGKSRSVILGRSDINEEDPVYGGALLRTWKWLEQLAERGPLDFGIAWLPACDDAAVLPDPVDAPVLLPAHLDAWVQTSLPIRPDPDVALWLHGPARKSADVQVVWRDLRQLHASGDLSQIDGDVIEQYLEAVRPAMIEAVSVPIAAARRWLLGESALPYSDATADDVVGVPSRGPKQQIPAWRWTGSAAEPVTESRLRPGDVLVVDCTAGGLREGAFDVTAKTPVDDVSELAQLRARGIATMVLTVDGAARWGIAAEAESLRLAGDETVSSFRERIVEVIGEWPRRAIQPSLLRDADREHVQRAFAKSLKLVEVERDGGETLFIATASARQKTLIEEFIAYEAVTESDDSPFCGDEVTLRQHSTDVKVFVGEFASRLGLDPGLCNDLMLAAWLHDVGKADPRFQAWLVGGDELRAAALDEYLAKSSLDAGNAKRRREARRRAGYPDGCRHELLSLAMISSDGGPLAGASDPELVKHLVASHHGWARPFAAPVDDPADLSVTMKHGEMQLSATTRHGLSRIDRGVVDRFWDLTRRYGWWGLAWLEAILRLADHRASEAADLERARSRR